MAGTVSSLILFGATGDLAKRMLLPSLYSLDHDGLLPGDLTIVGSARADMDDAEFRQAAGAALEAHLPDGLFDRRWPNASSAVSPMSRSISPTKVVSIAWRTAFPTARLELQSSCRPRRRCSNRRSPGCKAGRAHAAQCPDRAGKAARQRSRVQPRDQRRRRRRLSRGAHLPHRSLSRQGDGPEPARAALRQHRCSSRCGTPRTSITSRSPSPKRSGSKAAAAIYDEAGALRDMVQNHMLQLLALVAMEPPASFDADRGPRREGQGAARAAPIDAATRQRDASPANTAPARSSGEAVAGYDEGSGQAVGHRDLRRDQGPCRQLALDRACPSICAPASACPSGAPRSSSSSSACRIRSSPGAARAPVAEQLVIGSSPRRISAVADGQGAGPRPRRHQLARGAARHRLADAFAGQRRRIAYERLLLDLIEGDQTLFVRRDEVEAQWAWIDAIRAAWARSGIDTRSLTPPAAGGPRPRSRWTERDGVSWHE